MEDYNFKVGSKIVEAGIVYRIFKIDKKTFNGKREKFIYYKPYFKNESNQTIVCSIPVSNIGQTSIRKPVSHQEINDLITLLKTKTTKTDDFDGTDAKEILKENKIKKAALVAKKYWQKKHSQEEKLSFSQRRVMQDAIDSLTEEIALVNNISLEKAEKIITTNLAK
jgi:RNA polymerase-interacting CarD/CdnL/TRCF family regulator